MTLKPVGDKKDIGTTLRSCPLDHIRFSVTAGLMSPIVVTVDPSCQGRLRWHQAPVQLVEEQPKCSREGDQLVIWARAQTDETCGLILAIPCALSSGPLPTGGSPPLAGEKNKILPAEREWPNHVAKPLAFVLTYFKELKCTLLISFPELLLRDPESLAFQEGTQHQYFRGNKQTPRFSGLIPQFLRVSKSYKTITTS